jgi:hypothetical protein
MEKKKIRIYLVFVIALFIFVLYFSLKDNFKEVVNQIITMNIGYSARYEVDGSRGSIRLDFPTSSAKVILTYIERLYNEIADNVKDYCQESLRIEGRLVD